MLYARDALIPAYATHASCRYVTDVPHAHADAFNAMSDYVLSVPRHAANVQYLVIHCVYLIQKHVLRANQICAPHMPNNVRIVMVRYA